MAEFLTAAQRAAVEHFEGPLLVLAGPGSGKTRVITYRIARLIERGVESDQILALTFTNKAAREMASRVQSLVPGRRVQVSTFHRFCARLLRVWPEQAGLKSSFSILDLAGQIQLIRRLVKEAGFDTAHHEPRHVLGRISRARNDLITSEEFRRGHEQRVGDPLDGVVCEVFPRYEQELLSQNSVDFDGLLLHVVDMLSEDSGRRELLDDKFRFVLIDEYQDTNLAQYQIITGLSQQFPNVCATGDPDQSIYGWRGARPDNIARFERDFSNVLIVTLDENFRSTGAIVQCADALISRNSRRHPRQLTTSNAQGVPVVLRKFSCGDSEADGVASEIAQAVASGQRRYADFAVIYRVNALSRSIETALSRHAVPFQVAAGLSFYERAEIRDLIGYLRLIENPDDESAFLRVIKRPARGIGDRTLQRLRSFAQEQSTTLFDAAHRCDEVASLTTRSRRPLGAFTDLIQRLNILSADRSVAELIEQLIAEIDYLALWRDNDSKVDQDRAANVHELISAARQYEVLSDQDEEAPSLQEFLERASLTSEVDNVDESRGAVTLMTMHAAKGLEFPVVWVVGLENGLIPHERAVRDGEPSSFEEERRLLFVAVTRAQQELRLTQTLERTFRGIRRSTIPSVFTAEMPLDVQRDEDGLSELAPDLDLDIHLRRARERYEAAQTRGSGSAVISGTDLLCQKNQTATPNQGTIFPVGSTVRHPQYGRGVVVKNSGAAGRATVTVRFETDDREQTFVAGHCPLQPVG